MSAKRKVLAYILRVAPGGVRELLVFTHRGMPGAGIQVPGGTVEDGEDPIRALLREIEEESGLTGVAVIRPIGTYTYCTTDGNGLHIRHVFEVRFDRNLPVAWSHRVRSSGADNDLVFDFFWLPLERADILVGQMGRYRHDLGGPGN